MSYVLLYSGIGVSNAKSINSSNAIIQVKQTKTLSSNADILNEIAKTASSDAVIAQRNTKTASANAVIQARQTRSAATNAIIERAHKNALANAIISNERTKPIPSNAIITGNNTRTTSSNGVIQDHFTRHFSSNANVDTPYKVSSQAVIALTHPKTPGSTAVIKGTVLKTANSNVNIALESARNISAGAIILAKQTKPVSTSAVIISGIISRGAISDINLFAEYLRLLGILMLVDPSFQTELNTVPSQQTFTFVKKVVKGLFYVDITGGGAILSGQVRTGDGVAYSHQVNVSIRILGDTAVTATATTGTVLAGAGTKELWIQTDSTGAFVLNITGTGSMLIEMIPKQGVVMSQNITL